MYRTKKSNKQLLFCIRWVDEFIVAPEEFLGFHKVPNIESGTLVKIIKYILLRFQLSLQLCRGKCFDGASNMLGKRSGVAIQIYKEQPKVHYTHCHCYSFKFKYKRRNKIFWNAFWCNGHRWGDFCCHQIFTKTWETFGKP